MSFKDLAITSEEYSSRKKWLISFVVYYSFLFFLILLKFIFTKQISSYDICLWIIPYLYYKAYKHYQIAWLLLSTSLAPLYFVYTLARESVLLRQLPIIFLGKYVIAAYLLLFSYFLFNCYGLLRINTNYNSSNYNSTIKYLWIFSFLIYYSLWYLESVGKLAAKLNVSVLFGISPLPIYLIFLFVCYWLILKMQSSIALLILLFLSPAPFMYSKEIYHKIFWWGLFWYLCISSYRLYKINKISSKIVKDIVADDKGKPISNIEEYKTMHAVKNWIKLNFQCDSQFVYEPYGSTLAPDFLINFKQESPLLEIRRGYGFLLPSNTNEKIERQDMELINWEDKIQNLILKDNFLKPGETIILTITTPIPPEKRAKLAQSLVTSLKSSYKDNRIPPYTSNSSAKFKVTFNKVEITASLTEYYKDLPQYSLVKFIPAMSLQSSNLPLQSSLIEQAEYILRVAAEEKWTKLAHLNNKKWLAIFNMNPLLDQTTYIKAFKNLQNDTNFREKITAFENTFLIIEQEAIELKIHKS